LGIQSIEQNYLRVLQSLYSLNLFPPTIILRHRKENLKKCSLRGLNNENILFFTYPQGDLPSLEGYVVLTLGAPLLTRKDADKGLFLIDGTWRHAQTMYQERVEKSKERVLLRSLPPEYTTAYPRRQEDCPDPSRGLATIEALFIAYAILERNIEGLLDNYHWRQEFLARNQNLMPLFDNGTR
jgi:pre-rRNA-processing protein TSR3